MSSITPVPVAQQPDSIQDIVLQYIGQLCDGCGDTACTKGMCDTGRRNTAPPTQIIRKWTPRSARAIAIALAGGPHPRKHLCAFYSGPSTKKLSILEESEVVESPHDPSSIIQLLCDTTSVRRLCYAREQGLRCVRPVAYEDLSRSLDPLLRSRCVRLALQHTDSFVPNTQVAELLFSALEAFMNDLPHGSLDQWAYVGVFVDNGCAYPDKRLNAPPDMKGNVWLSLMDRLDHGPAARLLGKTVQALAFRTKVEQDVDDLKRNAGLSCRESGNARRIMFMLTERIAQVEWKWNMPGLVISLKKTFLLHWDGVSTSVARGSIACGALELLEALHTAFPSAIFAIPAVAMYLDAVDIAESWMDVAGKAGSRHILSFSFLFAPTDRAIYFRTMNHLRMRQAHSSSDKAAEIRRRAVPHTLDEEPVGQLRYAEEHYLLLNVNRSNLLRDAYDQLWQRRQSELLRPLRVRLGEVEELEIGHDLGGVQIEFFNLVCKEAFAEEAQMFTTDLQTGLSYFRPGSFQPLYMFELLGLLVALAMHNGITLPVNLPKAFYEALLSQDSNGYVGQGDVVAAITDGWPAESRSLNSVLREEIADLEYSFPLEANGLRMSVHMPQGVASDGCRVLEVAHATGDVHHSLSILEGIKWPGWRLVQSAQEPETVTALNKAQYVADYVRWVVWCSVEPQLTAFRGGFRKVVDEHSLSIFTPNSLKAFVEGSSRLDLHDLRKAIKYDGYDPNSKYMQSFWRILTSWPEEKQKQLLKFVTAAERIPIGGASNLTFVISRSAVEDLELLPTSSTCFGTLYLPRYPTAEVLNDKLSLAIKYGLEGFGTG